MTGDARQLVLYDGTIVSSDWIPPENSSVRLLWMWEKAWVDAEYEAYMKYSEEEREVDWSLSYCLESATELFECFCEKHGIDPGANHPPNQIQLPLFNLT